MHPTWQSLALKLWYAGIRGRDGEFENYLLSLYYLIGVYLTGVHLIGAYFMDVLFQIPHLTNGGAVVDLSRSELQNTSFCTKR
jgi:hypothetical protein